MSWYDTDWYFVTSQGGEISGAEIINAGVGGGSLFLRNQRTRTQLELAYGGFGAGIGAGFPINIDFSGQATESHGIGSVMSHDRRPLHAEDFAGPCVIGNLQYAGICEGAAAVAFCFNVPVFSGHPRALALIWGRNAGFEMGAGAMFYLGWVLARWSAATPHSLRS